MHQNTQCYLNSALKLHLPIECIEGIAGFQITLGTHHYFFQGFEHPFNNLSSAMMAINKSCTHHLLARAGIPVPKSIELSKEQYLSGDWREKLAALSYPLVIKPALNTALGRDVCCNIKTETNLIKQLEEKFSRHRWLLIEAFHGGLNAYRVLVFQGKILGVVHRPKAAVVGDGKHNIASLIALENEKRAAVGMTALGPILLDAECETRLIEQALSLESIPRLGQKILLNYTSNATRGGTFESLPIQALCQDNVMLMQKIARVMNLDLVGIDIECQDLKLPIRAGTGVIIEVNHNPSIRIHETPLVGEPNLVTRSIMRSLIKRHPFWYLKSRLGSFLK